MKNAHAVALGRLGGARGGHARATSLSPERRHEIAKGAAAARWGALPEFLRPLFWSYRFEELRLVRDEGLVMLHVLTHGRPQHVDWLRRHVGDDGIRSWIVRMRGKGLTIAQMARWVSPAKARRWQAENPGALIWEDR